MPTQPKLLGSDYYDSLPAPGFRAGDIWRDLPTFGLLGQPRAMGLVVTPACDLSNYKAETITYLPIIPITEYLSGLGMVPDILRALKGQARAAKVELPKLEACRRFEVPDLLDLQAEKDSNLALMTSLPEGSRRSNVARIVEGLKILERLRTATSAEDLSQFHALFGEKESAKIVDGIVRNNFKTDIHFLPADGKAGDLSAMPCHSVALFRYPLTLPCTILGLAEDLNQSDWHQTISANAATFPVCGHLEHRPLRISTLKPRFYSDIIARFVALLVRLGSPDFTEDTVEEFSRQARSGR